MAAAISSARSRSSKNFGLRTNKSIPRKLLDRADVDQAELALTTESELPETRN